MRSALAVLALWAAGCGSPLGPGRELAGEWATSPIPSGGSITMALGTNGTDVSGTGQSRAIGANGAITSFSVTGSRTGHGFVLALSFDSGRLVTYSGSFVDANTVAGPWEEAGQSPGFLTLHRQP